MNKILDNKTLKKIFVMIGMMSLIGGTFIAIMTYANIGFSNKFFFTWYSSLFFAILVMMPLGAIIMIISNKIVKISIPNQKEILQNIAIGILMALSMEAIMAVVTTINIHGYSDFNLFSSFWLKSYLLALPFALVMSPMMTILVKPKLDAYLAK
ncbi:DUF2798 domain-containing protein [Poseidonibacter antarcticus]|uniref:DUF2798 domain-containing protein n=1 Tax=Poseidonibacter antarcticus TaxID=2478538 RepID=UPI000EF4B8A4|nr:DUF2798 domain-containing protein [Poseidonibacter antarcticus]